MCTAVAPTAYPCAYVYACACVCARAHARGGGGGGELSHARASVFVLVSVCVALLITAPFINFLLHNHSVIYKILIFCFRRSKRQRNYSLFYFASQES